MSQEEKEERRLYGGLVAHQNEKFWGTFPGNYAWLCRLDSLKKTVGDFSPGEMKFLNLYQSSQMPELCNLTSDCDLKFHSVPHAANKAWFEEPSSPVAGVGQIPSSFCAPFVTSIRNHDTGSLSYRTKFQDTCTTNQKYDSHCFLPAACLEDLRLVHVDFVSGFLIAFYGEICSSDITRNQMWTVGMAVYCVESRSYYYIR